MYYPKVLLLRSDCMIKMDNDQVLEVLDEIERIVKDEGEHLSFSAVPIYMIELNRGKWFEKKKKYQVASERF